MQAVLTTTIQLSVEMAEGNHRFGVVPPNQNERELSKLMHRLENDESDDAE